jgi:ubiquitin carboxyl-terminal hydrolase 7
LMCYRSKVHTYDDVVERVARQIGLDDPSKIRLTSHNCYSQQPKPQPIKYRGVEHLSDMLVHYNQVSVTWVEVLVFILLMKLYNVANNFFFSLISLDF